MNSCPDSVIVLEIELSVDDASDQNEDEDDDDDSCAGFLDGVDVGFGDASVSLSSSSANTDVTESNHDMRAHALRQLFGRERWTESDERNTLRGRSSTRRMERRRSGDQGKRISNPKTKSWRL